MDLVDWKPEILGGAGATASGGCFYHVSVRSGSRASGSCASAAHEYITRSGEYDHAERDALVYTESDHLPSWAEDDPREYWDAADLYERANGRLYVSADFALPRDLDPKDPADLAHAFAQELTADERLRYTLAIHSGWDAGGHEHNPHAHLMISERQNHGITRSREQWFRRANSACPERGGAPKSRTFHGRDSRLSEIAALLGRVHWQLDLLAHDEDLRVVLQQERTWLEVSWLTPQNPACRFISTRSCLNRSHLALGA